MKSTQTRSGRIATRVLDQIEPSALAALRARLQGMPAAEAVTRYLPLALGAGRTARGILGDVRREIALFATSRGRPDLALVIANTGKGTAQERMRAEIALEEARHLPRMPPLLGDPIERWFSPKIVAALRAKKIHSLAELTLRTPRLRGWWHAIPGLTPSLATEVEGFFAANPKLTAMARDLLAKETGTSEIAPLERQSLRHELDGSQGRFRAPAATCALEATNDKEAIEAWLKMHESPATVRAYRKEAERLLLWAVVERAKPLSSLTTEDAVAYRSFLRKPTPRGRWVGPPRPRLSPEWRPFTGDPSSNSISYAMSVLAALFRWLVDKQYVQVNPFSGIKVRGAERGRQLDASRAFNQTEWEVVRLLADGLQSQPGWSEAAAQRLRFLLDFGYATGLRASELVGVTLGRLREENGCWWLEVDGKGAKLANVAVPPLAWAALSRYLVQRKVSAEPHKWDPDTSLVGHFAGDGRGITPARLWAILRKFFSCAGDQLQDSIPALAAKLRKASPHWMRHTHASHALAAGAELLTVRDNLRHASISTTSTYLHSDSVRRGQQMASVFAGES